jgi:hypothetical protein
MSDTLPAEVVEQIIDFAYPFGPPEQRLRQAIEHKLTWYLTTCTEVRYYWKLIYDLIDAGFSDDDLVAIIDNLYCHSRGWCTASIFSDVVFRAMRSGNMPLLRWAAPIADKHQFFKDMVENDRLDALKNFESDITPYTASIAVEEAIVRKRIDFLRYFTERNVIQHNIHTYVKYADMEVMDFFVENDYDLVGFLPEAIHFGKLGILEWATGHLDVLLNEDYHDALVAAARVRMDEEDIEERYIPDFPFTPESLDYVLRWLLEHHQRIGGMDLITTVAVMELWKSVIKNAYVQHRATARAFRKDVPWRDNYDYEEYYNHYMYPVYALRGLIM